MEDNGPAEIPEFSGPFRYSNPPFRQPIESRMPYVPRLPIDPGYSIDPGLASELSSPPDFADMKVKRGDVITADTMNTLIGVLQTLYEHVQAKQGGTASRSGRVMEVEGIGRNRAKSLARQGIVTLYDLGTTSPDELMEYISVKQKEASRIVKEAYERAGGTSGQPLTDLRRIGAEKAGRLHRAGIRSIKELSTANLQTIANALQISEDEANTVQNEARELIPEHAP